MSGFENGVLIAKNVNFNETAPKPHNGIITQNGQLLIGQAATPNIVAGFLTPGNGITITNGAGSITVAVSGNLAIVWSDQNANFGAVVNHGYFVTGTTTATLPANPSEGDVIAFVVDDTNVTTITANAGQKIRIGSVISALAGTAASNARGDSITLVFRTSGSTWFSWTGPQGTWSVT